METLYFMGKLLSFLCTISDMPYSCSITCLFSIPRSYTCKIGCQSSFLSTRNRHEFLWLLYEIPRRRETGICALVCILICPPQTDIPTLVSYVTSLCISLQYYWASYIPLSQGWPTFPPEPYSCACERVTAIWIQYYC